MGVICRCRNRLTDPRFRLHRNELAPTWLIQIEAHVREDNSVADGWERLLMLVGVLAAILGRSGCPLGQSPPSPSLQPDTPSDLAVSVTVVATPSHRLIATPEEAQGPSRLIAVHARLENGGSDAFLFNPANVALMFSDGTQGHAFDRQRAAALIERLEIAPTGASSPESPDLLARARTPGVQEQLKRQVIEDLLDERLLGSEAIQGYLLLDTKGRSASLDGAILHVSLIRARDGAALRQLYRFAGGSEAAAASSSVPRLTTRTISIRCPPAH
jgi:hypothetical protein